MVASSQACSSDSILGLKVSASVLIHRLLVSQVVSVTDQMSVSLQNVHVEIQTPNVMVLGDKTFGKYISQSSLEK